MHYINCSLLFIEGRVIAYSRIHYSCFLYNVAVTFFPQLLPLFRCCHSRFFGTPIILLTLSQITIWMVELIAVGEGWTELP